MENGPYRSNRPSQRRLAAWSTAMLLWLLPLAQPAMAAADLADPDVAVETAGEGLSRYEKPKWYDSETDAFRPAEVKPPRKQRQMNPGFAELLMHLGWILLAAMLLYLVYLIIRTFLTQEIVDSLPIERGPTVGDVSRVEQLPIALKKAPSDFLAEAQRLYSRGDYAQAVVYLFSHQLIQLDRRHLVRLIKGKTNRQYLREIRRSSAGSASKISDLFEQTVLLFEEIFFGKRLPPQSEVDKVWSNIETFHTLLDAGEERAA